MTPIPLTRPLVRSFDHPTVVDIEGTVRGAIARSRIGERLGRGSEVAVAVGSRGIANLARIVRASVRTLEELGYRPFIVAGMGTHGNGTPEGQRQILADFGVTQEALGVPISTAMDATPIGTSSLGAPVYWDSRALAADGVVAINRIKAHTDFSGRIESGVIKMLAIGLGKRESPRHIHRLGGNGMEENIVASAKVVLEKAPVALGIAVVENAAEETALIQAIEPEELFATEPALLERAKAWMARLPFERADVVIIGELGKNYSGAGIDPNVIGRRKIEGQGDFPSPVITRLAVLDVSPESHGNTVGTGFADLVSRRLIEKTDHEAVRLNTLTAQFLERSRVPLACDTDRQVIETALETCWVPDLEQVRLAVIPNTLELGRIYVSERLAENLDLGDARGEIGPPTALPFLPDDRLDQAALFPHALQGRRSQRADPMEEH